MHATAAPAYFSCVKASNLLPVASMRVCLYFLYSLLLLSLVPSMPGAQDRNAPLPPLPIASIVFEGNASIGERQLKSQLYQTNRMALYTPESLQADLLRLEELYKDEGYLSVKIGPPDVRIQAAESGKAAAILIPVEEGTRFLTGIVAVKGLKVLEPAPLIQLFPLQKGQPYRRSQVNRWLQKILETYNSIGHIKARCNVAESLNAPAKTVDCSLECSEGKAYRVGRITITGDKSIDHLKFIRRLLVSEGGIFSPDNLVLSIQLLNQSGLYKPISNSDIEMKIDDDSATVDLTFRLAAPSP